MKKYSFKKEEGKIYDEEIRTVAKRRVGIILLVVAYIFYLVYQIVTEKMAGTSAMSWTEVVIAGCVLVIGSLTVLVIAILRMGKEFAESEITELDGEGSVMEVEDEKNS